MTIGGALQDLRILLAADDIPWFYKPSIQKIIETIEMDVLHVYEQEEKDEGKD